LRDCVQRAVAARGDHDAVLLLCLRDRLAGDVPIASRAVPVSLWPEPAFSTTKKGAAGVLIRGVSTLSYGKSRGDEKVRGPS
jgi:hypothetical protein